METSKIERVKDKLRIDDTSDSGAENIDAFISQARQDRTLQNKLRYEKVKIQNWEFVSAIIGTFVWGFGDLPFV